MPYIESPTMGSYSVGNASNQGYYLEIIPANTKYNSVGVATSGLIFEAKRFKGQYNKFYYPVDYDVIVCDKMSSVPYDLTGSGI